MASIASDSRGLLSPNAAPASAFFHVDDHPLSVPPSSSTFLDGHAASCSFHLPSGSFPTASAHDPSPPAAAARKPSRKRPRPSLRPPTTVLITDANNFRAMVQEFTGFPAPPHLRPGGVLFGADPSVSSTATTAPFQLLRSAHLKVRAASRASLLSCTTSNTSSLVLSPLARFAKNNASDPAAAAGAATPSSGAEFYSSYGPMLARAVPFDDGFEAAAAAAAEGERAGPGHGIFSSQLHDVEWYHRH